MLFPVDELLPGEFIAIDVETATWDQESICQVGLAVVKNGSVTDSRSWLVRPPGNHYFPKNIAIHGIMPRMTENQPSFGELWPVFSPYFEGKVLAAHYANFDMTSLAAAAWVAGRDLRIAGVLDSCIAARRSFPELADHKLPTVCSYLGIPLEHHDAQADALACAKILIATGSSPLLSLAEACDKRAYNRHFMFRGR